jgi:hypothetical protein
VGDRSDRSEIRAGGHDDLDSVGSKPFDRGGKQSNRATGGYPVGNVVGSNGDHSDVRPVRLDLVDLCLEVTALGTDNSDTAQVHFASDLASEPCGDDCGCGLFWALHAEPSCARVAEDGQGDGNATGAVAAVGVWGLGQRLTDAVSGEA